jgi:hypothetical protein
MKIYSQISDSTTHQNTHISSNASQERTNVANVHPAQKSDGLLFNQVGGYPFVSFLCALARCIQAFSVHPSSAHKRI